MRNRRLNPAYCKEFVPSPGMAMHDHQCNRKVVKDGYCTQHHPDAKAARVQQAEQRYQAKQVDERLRRMRYSVSLLRAAGYIVTPPKNAVEKGLPL